MADLNRSQTDSLRTEPVFFSQKSRLALAKARWRKVCSCSTGRKLAERVGGETLSPREIDALKLMAQGKSNKEIRSALFISEGTAKPHVKAIFARMNVTSRNKAVAIATRRGLIQL